MLTIEQLRDFCFSIQKEAIELNVGLSLGIMSTNANEHLPVCNNELAFELTDSPFEQTADDLFSTDSYQNNLLESEQLDLEHFTIKMNSIKSLLLKMFSFKEVDNVLLLVNYIFGEIDITRSICVDEFTEKISDDYSALNYVCPALMYKLYR